MRILNPMPQIAENWFSHERVRDDLYLIIEPHYRWFSRANIWLVRGRDAYLLVDTGLGVSSLKAYLTPLLDKPLKVVASHVHFDHAGGCHEFDDVHIHKNEHAALCNGDQDLMLAKPEYKFVVQADFEQFPFEDFAAESFAVKPCPQAQELAHGDVIDLGDKAFEVLHLPGHSPGSVGLLERHAGQFFSGDIVYDGELLDKLAASVIDDYIDSMECLLSLKVDEVNPGHYQSFDRRYLHELVKKYIESKRAPVCPADSPK